MIEKGATLAEEYCIGGHRSRSFLSFNPISPENCTAGRAVLIPQRTFELSP
jgi:hypothetical protein